MKHTYTILLLILMFTACSDDSYFHESTPETVDMSMWDYLQTDSSHRYFMELVSKFGLIDIINSNNPVTLFIPSDESLKGLDTTDIALSGMLNYIVAPTLVNVQSMTADSKIQTLSNKFASLEYNSSDAEYFFDGKKIVESSPLFTNGRFYVLDDIVWPVPNLYEYISEKNSVFKKYIDLQDSTYFDLAASTPIDFGIKGTIYDSIFTTVNLFYKNYFPIKDEYRYKTSTFVLFTQEQLDAALEIVKTDLRTTVIPDAWLNGILLPYVISNSIFENSLNYTDFTTEMLNIRGKDVLVNVNNIDKDSRFKCSNGIAFNMSEFIVPEVLYKAQKVINGYDAVTEIIAGDKWIWSPLVKLQGLEGTSVEPTLKVNDLGSLNSKILSLNMGSSLNKTFKLTFTQKGVFGSEKYRLVWSGSSTYCGLYKIYINGQALQMRNYAGKNQDYFDSFEFSNTVIKSVAGNGVYSKVGNFNKVDFAVSNITEYSDVEITFEYLGPSKDSKGVVRGNPGLIIDYFKLEIYE